MPEVIMPKMGDAMTEGKILRWIKDAGDGVTKGEPIAEIETDKVNVDLEAEWEGTLAKILVAAGEVAPVGAPIAVIAGPGEDAAATPAAPRAGEAPGGEETGVAPPAETPEPARAAKAKATQPAAEQAPAPPGAPPGEVRASPLARRLAAQHQIPLADIRGTGPEGRITKDDVEAHVAAQGAPAAAPAAAAPAAPAQAAREAPLSRMRQTIARRMTESKQHAPHFYVTVSIAMDAALEVRRQLNERLGEERKVSVNDLIVKASALALARFPNVNASYAGEAIRHPEGINVSIAIALPEGLISPTLHGCDRKPVWQIAEEARALAERARSGRLKPDDLTGGTFTVSNLGMFDVDSFVAIINPPQAAILAVGAARPKAVVRDGRVEVATMMEATLSADHRVTDGAEAATFLLELRRLLENPVWLLVDGV